jgi:hypothetical protein
MTFPLKLSFQLCLARNLLDIIGDRRAAFIVRQNFRLSLRRNSTGNETSAHDAFWIYFTKGNVGGRFAQPCRAASRRFALVFGNARRNQQFQKRSVTRQRAVKRHAN